MIDNDKGIHLGGSLNLSRFGARFVFAVIGVLGLAGSAQAQTGYVSITNRTGLFMYGTVSYLACRSDRFNVDPGKEWRSNGRGMCLITKIEAFVRPDPAAATPAVTAYTSSGTGYADFFIGQSGATYRVWSTKEMADNGLEVPTGPAKPVVEWSTVANVAPPAFAFKGGRQQFGGRSKVDDLPVCRGQSNGVSAVGNAAPFWKHGDGWSWDVLSCAVFLDGKEVALSTYEVMRLDPEIAVRNPNALRWVPAANGAMPPGAYNAAAAGTPVYACRAQTPETDNFLRVGMVGPNGCYMPYGNQNRFAANYEVLVADSALSEQLARGPNEPRLAAEPDRPAFVSLPGEDCTRFAGRCKARTDAFAAVGAYRINAVYAQSSDGITRFKKTQGNIWMMTLDTGPNRVRVVRERPYVEVERTDDYIMLFSGPWDFGGPNGKAGPNTVVFSINAANINMGPPDAILQVWGEAGLTSAGPAYRNSAGRWVFDTSTQTIQRAGMAEPDTALTLSMRPLNGDAKSTFWTGGDEETLTKDAGGNFDGYRVASSGDGWLELYRVVGNLPFAPNSWKIHFLKVDFLRSRVWELLGETNTRPTAQDAAGLRELARKAGPSNAWAEAYALTKASVFSGNDVGTVLGRINDIQMAWTLREQAGSVIRWEELKSSGRVVQATAGGNLYGSTGAPSAVGRFVTETARTPSSLTLSGSEFGSPLTINWVDGTVNVGNRRVGDFLTAGAEFTGQRKKLPTPTPPGISPGFQFVNKTDWPVLVKVGQVACLYHGVVPPHTTMTRNTGAVWFTLSASWSSDGKDLTKEQEFTDCVAPVAFTVLGVIATAATGGSATGVVALGATAAATAGAATTAVQFMNAAGASQGAQDVVAAGIYVVAAAATGGAGAFQVVSTKLAPGATVAATKSTMAAMVAKGAAQDALVNAAARTNLVMLSALNLHEPDEKELQVLQSWFGSEISLAGQYAGYPWPWKMKDRVMPQYEITGGPRVDTLKDGSKLIRKGEPFKFVRVN